MPRRENWVRPRKISSEQKNSQQENMSKLKLHKNNHETREKDKYKPAVVKEIRRLLKTGLFLNAEENVSRKRPSLSEASEL